MKHDAEVRCEDKDGPQRGAEQGWHDFQRDTVLMKPGEAS